MLKKILLPLILIIITATATTQPKWIIEDPDSNGIYFRGVSTWYVSNDASVNTHSQKDALHNAYSKVSDYFGLNIKSTYILNKENHNGQSSTTTKQNIQTKTNQLVLGLKPIKTFTEYTEDEKNFRFHLLLNLDKKTEKKINLEMKKDHIEFQELKNKILIYINKKDFFNAENLLAIAKGKRAAFMDDTLLEIENRLKSLKEGQLSINLNLNKKYYLPEEIIYIETSLNSNGYLYLMYDTGNDIEMIFPNKYNRNNHLKKGELISFPNEDINTIAYEESKNLTTKIYAVASKKYLQLKKYKDETIDGVDIFSKEGKHIDIINQCISQNLCTKSEIKFIISNKSNYPKITLIFNTTPNYQAKIIQYLKQKGIQSEQGNASLEFNINPTEEFSSLLNKSISKFNIQVELFQNQRKTKILKQQCSQSRLNITIEELYKKITKGL